MHESTANVVYEDESFSSPLFMNSKRVLNSETFIVLLEHMLSVSYLLTEVGPLEGNHADIDCVGDKGLVVHELIRGEGGDCVEEELSSLFEVPDGHTVQALVDFQTIPPVPVAPLLDEAVVMEVYM